MGLPRCRGDRISKRSLSRDLLGCPGARGGAKAKLGMSNRASRTADGGRTSRRCVTTHAAFMRHSPRLSHPARPSGPGKRFVEPVILPNRLFVLFVFSGNINPRAQTKPFDCMLCLSNIIQADCELWILPQLCPVSVNSEHARAGAHVEGTAGLGLWRWGAHEGQCRPTAGGTLRSRRPGHVSVPPSPMAPSTAGRRRQRSSQRAAREGGRLGMATANQGARLRPFRAAGARTKSMGSQRRAGPPRGSGGRLKQQPPERQSPRDAGGAEPREDTQEEKIWGLGGSGASRARPGFRTPHRLLRAATTATAAILCRVCSLTPSLPSPCARRAT